MTTQLLGFVGGTVLTFAVIYGAGLLLAKMHLFAPKDQSARPDNEDQVGHRQVTTQSSEDMAAAYAERLEFAIKQAASQADYLSRAARYFASQAKSPRQAAKVFRVPSHRAIANKRPGYSFRRVRRQLSNEQEQRSVETDVSTPRMTIH